MRKLFCIVSIVIFWSLMVYGLCYASPFLVCDPQTGVASYQFSGDSFFATKTSEADGSLRYDLATIPTGTHNITIIACNMWGCSSTPTPFSFSVSIPSAPSGLKLVP